MVSQVKLLLINWIPKGQHRSVDSTYHKQTGHLGNMLL